MTINSPLPPRDQPLAVSTPQRILEAAAQVFSDQGYNGATTRAIAAAAGVNEVTLFRHFGTKHALFQAVVGQFCAVPGLANMAAKFSGDYRADLTAIATHFMAMLRRNRRAILMSMAEAQYQPEVRSVISATPLRQRELLAGYLRRQMEQGRVRPLANPELVAQAFFGMFLEYSLAQMLADPAAPASADDEVIAQFVALFVQGTEA